MFVEWIWRTSRFLLPLHHGKLKCYMKKIILLLMTLVGVLTAQAEETYTYLTFETTDGAKAKFKKWQSRQRLPST